jgi:23S rRNA pseudouridine1911/1915/1917 synthase
LLGELDGRFLFEIKLITGRSHQIRVQMAHIGCPLLGDVKYGNPLEKPAYVLALYAYSLTFSHPTLRESMTFRYFPKANGYFSGFESIFPKENIK